MQLHIRLLCQSVCVCVEWWSLTSPPHFVNSPFCIRVRASHVFVCLRTCVRVKDKPTERENVYQCGPQAALIVFIWHKQKRGMLGEGWEPKRHLKERKEQTEKRPLQESIQPDDLQPRLAVNLSSCSLVRFLFTCLFVVFYVRREK